MLPPLPAAGFSLSVSFSEVEPQHGRHPAPDLEHLTRHRIHDQSLAFQLAHLWRLQQVPRFSSLVVQSIPPHWGPTARYWPFLLLVARCHWQNQVRNEEGHLAPQSLGWSRCVGFCCLHPSVMGLQSNRCILAVQISRDPLDCLQVREPVSL